MLDALKFAFEILIVGALAIPWLAVLHRMFPSSSESSFDSFLSFIPKPAQDAVAIVVVVAFGYFLGSGVSRFSRDFFNDELWQPFPTENLIRDGVYYDEFCSKHLLVYKNWPLAIHLKPPPDFCPNTDKYEWCYEVNNGRFPALSMLSAEQLDHFDERVEEVFGLQESELLLEGTDKVDRLKQYFDQISVLRGAAFNGCVLFALCAFGSLGILWGWLAAHRFLRLFLLLPPGLLLYYGVHSLCLHAYDPAKNLYSDPPLAELVIVLLGALGLWVIPKAHPSISYFRICVIAAILTAISFGGWWWTEVMYDNHVIHSEPELKRDLAAAGKAGSETQTSPESNCKAAPSKPAPNAPNDKSSFPPSVNETPPEPPK